MSLSSPEEAGLRGWQFTAAEQQQTFYGYFGDREWDKFPNTDTNTLNTKISYTLFDTPYEKCSTEQKDTISATREKVLELCGSGDVYFGCIFVIVLPNDPRESRTVPLIRTRQTYGGDIYFVESQPGRVYTGWTDYLDNNQLPSGNMCYPVDGFYRSRSNQRVNIEFREIYGKSTVGAVLDVASCAGKIASTGLIATSLFFPLAAPLVIGAVTVLGTSTAYSTTRGICDIVDRSTHHESVGADVWIGMGADVIGAILMGGAAILPRLVASGRITASMVSTIVDLLNWVSLGVNSFGVVANVVILIGKFRSGTLESSDIAYFISSCLFIGNIVVNAVVAEKVIQSLSNRPSQLGNIFKMISTSPFCAVKTISVAVTGEAVLETICSETAVAFMRYFGMNHVAQFLQGVKGLLRRFRRGAANVWTLCIELQRLLSCHLMQVIDEVAEAWKKTRFFFSGFDVPLGVFTGPSVEAAEIVNGAERVVDEIDAHSDEGRKSSCDAVMRAALQMAKKMNAQTEREFSNLCQMAMNDIRRRCDRRLVVGACERNYLLEEDRRAVLLAAIQEFRDEFDESAKSSPMNGNAAPNSNVNLIPLTMTDDIDAYVFQARYRVPEFDQLVYDAACHLLKSDDFLDRCRIEFGDGPIILIQSLGNTLIFCYQQLEDSDTAIGFVLLKD